MSRRLSMKALALALPCTALLLALPAGAQAPADPTTPPPPKPKPASQQRAEIRKECDQMLANLYKAKPETKAEIAKAPGYGCFSSFGVSFIVGGAGGRGLVYDNATKKTTYMNMGQASAGLDIGIKNYAEVLVFRDAKTMGDFVDKGWELTGSAGASAAAGGKGGTAEKGGAAQSAMGEATPIQIYPMTKTGLAAGASAAGRKYWKDKDLN